jgi:hypothetical protein
VERITLDDRGRATGVQLRGGNASVWDTVNLLPRGHAAAQAAVLKMDREAQATPECNSFMHLHVGFDKTGVRGGGPRPQRALLQRNAPSCPCCERASHVSRASSPAAASATLASLAEAHTHMHTCTQL